MDLKDRERLALSTGIVLVGYAVIFVLLMGLHWPPAAPFRSISPPVSVYVNLEGNSLSELTATQTKAASPEKASARQPTASTEESQSAAQTSVSSPDSVVSPSDQPATKVPASPSVASRQQPSAAPSPVPSQATAIPRGPNIPQSMTSTGGGTSTNLTGVTGPTSQRSGPVTGPQSARPGVNYPQGAQQSSSPPQGAGGAGTETDQGQSQTFYGPKTQAPTSIFNSDLAAAAGSSSPSPGSSSSSQGAPSTSGASGAAGGQSGAAAGGSTGGSGSVGSQSAPSSTGPNIQWKSDSAQRRVMQQPEPFKIPEQYLNEIPPTIELKIAFSVSPSGNVNVLNITPSLVYPELNSALEAWMEKWRFQPVGGDQVAQGTLQYVIQADTAR